MIYTVTFSPALDYYLHLDAVRLGEVNRAQSVSLRMGGKGLNVSQVLHNLGTESLSTGFVAGFTGQEIVRLAHDAGIRESMISLPKGASRINVKIKSEQETEINAPGPVVDAAALQKLFALLDALQSGDVLVLSGSAPTGAEGGLYADLVRLARSKGAQAVVDAVGEQLIRAIPEKPLLIKPNLAELAQLTGDDVTTEAQAIHHARRLWQQGAQNVMVSMGGEGALLVCESGVYRCEAPKGTVVNTTGSGDTMVAAFLHGRADREDGDLLRFCVAAGSAGAFMQGLPTWADIEAVLTKTPQATKLPY